IVPARLGSNKKRYEFSTILLGIFSWAFTCGSADLLFDRPKPAEGSPCGDAILGSVQELVLLKRGENTVNIITCGSILAA
ncbi:hypothetical protein EV401DRAFT_1908943, partial [Pisolithus croceorrhizus]